MTEEEWVQGLDPSDMLSFLMDREAMSERKMRLFACACFRRRKARLEKWEQEIVSVAERYADGLADQDQLASAHDESYSKSSNVVWLTIDMDSWSVEQAARVACDALGVKQKQVALVRDLFSPFRGAKLTPSTLILHRSDVIDLAHAAYENRILPSGNLDRDRLAVLSDALEEAGCDDAAVLDHLRGPGPHVRGCWVVDLLLGRA